MNLMFVANQVLRMYKSGDILVYPLVQLPVYLKDFLKELRRSVLKNVSGRKQDI